MHHSCRFWIPLMAFLPLAACFSGADSEPPEAGGMVPGVENVRLGISPGALLSARPNATADSYAYQERLESGGTVTYLFRDHLPASAQIDKNGLLAVVVDYSVSEADTAEWAGTLERLRTHWRAIGKNPQTELELPVPKFRASPPIRTSLEYWRLPEVNVALYAELEAPGRSSRQVRLIRTIVQDRELSPAALLPDAYKQAMRAGDGAVPRNQP